MCLFVSTGAVPIEGGRAHAPDRCRLSPVNVLLTDGRARPAKSLGIGEPLLSVVSPLLTRPTEIDVSVSGVSIRPSLPWAPYLHQPAGSSRCGALWDIAQAHRPCSSSSELKYRHLRLCEVVWATIPVYGYPVCHLIGTLCLGILIAVRAVRGTQVKFIMNLNIGSRS